MGDYTKRLSSRLNKTRNWYKGEHLVSCAIILSDGTPRHGFKTHAALRRSLGFEHPYETLHGTQDGFWTSKGRFVDRWQAGTLAYVSGQSTINGGALLSDCVLWWPADKKTGKS